MPFSKRLEEIKVILPLYSKRLIENDKAKEIEKILQSESALQEELKFWDTVKKGYEKIKSDLPEPSYNIYPKIIRRIEGRERIQNKIWNFISLKPEFSFGFIIFQFLVIIVMFFYILNLKYGYQTLSTTDIRAETSYVINVVFKENAKERDIRELLTKIDGRIIGGPYRTGLYVVGIKDREKKDQILNILRQSNIIVLAEPAK